MGGYPSQMFAHLYPQKVQCFIGVDTTPFGTAYYSKSDLWWLSKVKPMANWFSDKILRKSMAKSISVTEYSYNKMIEMLTPLSKEQIIEQMDIAYTNYCWLIFNMLKLSIYIIGSFFVGNQGNKS